METLAEGKYLSLHKKGTWEYTTRANAGACVGILAITDQHDLLLIEQFRTPVEKSVIEVPAGLFGDEEEFLHESLAECANRELIEETGYSAAKIEPLIATPSSAGLTNEIIHLFFANSLTRVSEGGGTANEDIIVHHVPLHSVHSWCQDKVSQGYLIDGKIFTCLELARSKQFLAESQ